MTLGRVGPAHRGAHTFPHRDIRVRIRTARKARRCDTRTEPQGHTVQIAAGEAYASIAIQPAGRDGWRHVSLCEGCAIHFGLAERVQEEEGAQA